MAIIETSRPVPFGAVSTFRVVNFFDKCAMLLCIIAAPAPPKKRFAV